MLDQRRSDRRDVRIMLSMLANSIVDPIIEETESTMPSLDRLVHIPQVVDSHTLHSGSNHIPSRQYTGEQGRREHQGKNDQQHLHASAGNVTYPNLKKDQVAQRQQHYSDDNDQRRD